MSRLLVFNPEHDYALAHGGWNYMPPKSVRKLSEDLELLPLIWSDVSDYILLYDNSILCINSWKVVNAKDINPKEVVPWGWDPSLLSRIRRLGFTSIPLPSSEDMNNLRRLSHRRISILCNKALNSPYIPVEFTDTDDALEFSRGNPGCYFKMPWSSGGRGIVATKELSTDQIREWVSGSIKKQGSVLAEPGIERTVDFASLWNIETGKEPFFEGLSLSLSDGRGKYDGNVYAPQEWIQEYIQQKSSSVSLDVIKHQKDFIKKEIAPYYQGKIGIDMMGDSNGNIYPCVEINLRRTMGHVALEYQKLSAESKERLGKLNLPLKNYKDYD